jgi:hypothetical protein
MKTWMVPEFEGLEIDQEWILRRSLALPSGWDFGTDKSGAPNHGGTAAHAQEL